MTEKKLYRTPCVSCERDGNGLFPIIVAIAATSPALAALSAVSSAAAYGVVSSRRSTDFNLLPTIQPMEV